MKKKLLLITVVLFVFLLSGCASNGESIYTSRRPEYLKVIPNNNTIFYHEDTYHVYIISNISKGLLSGNTTYSDLLVDGKPVLYDKENNKLVIIPIE